MTGGAGDTAVSLAAVRDSARELTDTPTRRAAAERAVAVLRDVVGLDHATVYLRNDSPPLLMTAATTDAATREFEVPNLVESPTGPLAAALASGEPVVSTADESTDTTGFGDAGSRCVVPVDDEGAIVVVRSEPSGFDDDTVTAVTLVGAFLEAAIAGTGGVADTGPESARMQALSRAFPDYAFHYDADGTYLDVLLGWTNIQLYRREELVGNTVYDVLDEEVASQVHGAIRRAIDDGEQQVLEYTVETPGGDYHYEARAVPVLEEGTETVVVVARDITDRHERERELQRQNDRLDEFASVVSHDLRNPLNTADGYLELAAEDIDDPNLAKARAAINRMEELVTDLLELARTGRSVDEPASVGFEAVVTEAWNTAADDSATLVVEDGPDDVLADRPRLLRLFENLFRNAVEQCGPEPIVEVGSLEGGFYVEDTGPGIPPDRRKSVFEPGHTSAEDGTGLGLSIVNRIAEAHGWTIDAVAGRNHGGARFEITGVREP